jgi:hypothetical protein
MMNTIPSCVAPKTDRQNADLKLLPQLAGTVDWISEESMAEAPVPLVITGEWAVSNPERAAQVFANRSSHGLHTIVVPKFRPSLWTKILAAPTKVEVVGGEFRSFEWQAVHHAVPGFVVFRSSLHAAKWGEAPGLGTVVLGYRPHLAAGVIVLCSAVLTAKVLGVSLSAQQALYGAISDAIATPVRNGGESIESEPAEMPSTLDEFLAQEKELGAAFLFGKLLSTDESPELISTAVRTALGIVLDHAAILRLSRRIPLSTGVDMRTTLQKHGWGAYLRRLAISDQVKLASERSEA